MNLVDFALEYRRTGLSVLSANQAKKFPAIPAWKTYQERLPTEPELRAWFANNPDALCLICGKISGNLELLDFDCQADLFPSWRELVNAQAPGLLERLYIESSQSAGKHVVYRCETEVSRTLKLAQRRIDVSGPGFHEYLGKKLKARKDANNQWHIIPTLIETRGEGGLFLCAPSEGYQSIQGSLSNIPVITTDEREILLGCAWSLNEYIEPTAIVNPSVGINTPNSMRPGDDFNRRGDIRPILQAQGWTMHRVGENEHWCRPGKQRATSATLRRINDADVFYCFTSNAPPLEQDKAYSSFTVFALLEHSGDFTAAAAALRARGYGDPLPLADVNLSTFSVQCADTSSPEPNPDPDPGPVPDELLRVPGFISEVMDHSLKTAPYPNHVMAFCGALSFQAFLAGRKVRDIAGNRTNIYLLGLAHSATGKDWPRKLNVRIAHRIGLSRAIAERFASGEGLQDALCADPCMLFQTDEIDGLFRQVNGAQDARHENIITQLLMMYSSASTVFPMRKLAKTEHAVIDQPCLVLFGTAIPNHYYDALSSRMLTNGLFARMLVLESGPRSKGRDAQELDPPPRVLAIAKWWADFLPGNGNLRDWHPIPICVDQTEEARKFLAEAREQAEAEYSAAESRNDALGTTVWGRVDEQTRKLALIHAISGDHEDPQIDKASVQWAHALVTHQVKRMLFMARNYVADNPFEAECLKLIRKLREAGGTLSHSAALKNMHMQSKPFLELIQTMEQRGEVATDLEPSQKQGRPNRCYRLIRS